MEIADILDDLAFADGTYPSKAVREAVRRREEITPELLRILDDVADHPESFASDDDTLSHIFALYLLAKFREGRRLLPCCASRPCRRTRSTPYGAMSSHRIWAASSCRSATGPMEA